MVGRSDDTMNLGGIKVGCAEIERVLNRLPGVHETAAVAMPPSGGGPSRLVVFLVPATDANAATADAFKPLFQEAIRSQLNPLFHIDTVRIVGVTPADGIEQNLAARTAGNGLIDRHVTSELDREASRARVNLIRKPIPNHFGPSDLSENRLYRFTDEATLNVIIRHCGGEDGKHSRYADSVSSTVASLWAKLIKSAPCVRIPRRRASC